MSILLPILSVVPGLALTWRLRRSRAARRESLWLAFGAGAVALMLVLIPGSWVVSRFSMAAASPWQRAFLFAALPEETMKLAILMGILIWVRSGSSRLRLSVAVSLGFATAESIVFALHGSLQGALIHMLIAVPAHAAFGAVLATVASLDRPRPRRILLAWSAAVLAHGLYDLPLFQLAEPTPFRLPWLASWAALYAVGVRWTWKTLRRDELDQEATEADSEDALTPAPEPRSIPRSVPPTRAPRPARRAPHN